MAADDGIYGLPLSSVQIEFGNLNQATTEDADKEPSRTTSPQVILNIKTA